MAAITPASVLTENMGSMRLVVARFSSVSDGDTWASGINGIQRYWTTHNANPATQASVGCALTVSGTTFTLYPAENSAPIDVFVTVKG